MDNKEIIQEILARESRQIQVDVTRLMQQTDIKSYEQAAQMEKMLRDYLVKREMKKYPLDEEMQRESKRKYTESARIILETEKRLKESEVIHSVVEEYKKRGEDKTLIQKFIEMVTGENQNKEPKIVEESRSFEKKKKEFNDKIKVSAVYSNVGTRNNIIKAKEIQNNINFESEK